MYILRCLESKQGSTMWIVKFNDGFIGLPMWSYRESFCGIKTKSPASGNMFSDPYIPPNTITLVFIVPTIAAIYGNLIH